MRLLCKHELHLISGGNGWGMNGDPNCPYCNGDFDEATGQFVDAYRADTANFPNVGYGRGSNIGSVAFGTIAGTMTGGNPWATGAATLAGSETGRYFEGYNNSLNKYFDVKKATEPIYGIQ